MSTAEVFPNNGKLFSNINGERQMNSVFDCFVFLDKDTGIMPKKQIGLMPLLSLSSLMSSAYRKAMISS
jgi:hypothetical protein